MQEFSALTRRLALDRMEAECPLDLLVIGGGITGVATARDAVRRGLRTALVEKGDLASGTSSRSSKLVHGGLRYLENLEFGLVHEGCSERRVLLDRDPAHVEALEFVFPVYSGDPSGYYAVKAGMLLYDALAAFRNVQRHHMLSPEQVEERIPGVRREGLKGGASYYDARTDDARYCMATARAASREGALVATYAEAVELDCAQNGVTATVCDRIEDRELAVRARAVMLACGPWTDAVRERLLGHHRPVLRPTKGVHIVVSRSRLPLTRSLLMRHPEDGRVVFNIPWGPASILGTTDTDHDGPPEEAHAEASDVEYILRVTDHAFPEARLTAEDVISTYTGLRPLMLEEGVDEGATSREHAILEDGAVFTVAGGKWTTHRRMARDAVDRVVERLGMDVLPCTTATAPVEDLGAALVDFRDDPAVEGLARREGVPADTVRRLSRHYGRGLTDVLELLREEPAGKRPVVEGHAPILAEARLWARHELALTLTDALDRRTSLALVASGQALEGARAVAGEMARELGWSEDEIERQVEEYRRHVGRSRAWRTPGS